MTEELAKGMVLHRVKLSHWPAVEVAGRMIPERWAIHHESMEVVRVSPKTILAGSPPRRYPIEQVVSRWCESYDLALDAAMAAKRERVAELESSARAIEREIVVFESMILRGIDVRIEGET